MRRKRILGTLVLALLLASALCLPAGAFSREPAGWAAQHVEHLEDAGILRSEDSTVKGEDPGKPIKRWAFCQLLVDVVQNTGDWGRLAEVPPAAAGYFGDLSGSSYNPLANSADVEFAMRYGAAYGITEGSSKDGKRVADAQSLLTREQAAKMMCALVDALEKYAGVPAPQEGVARTFADQGSIASWAAQHVARASALGILQGDSAGKFNPKGTLTWQEACVMVDRIFRPAQEAAASRLAEQGVRSMTTALSLEPDCTTYTSANVHLLRDGSVLVIDSAGKKISVERYDAGGASVGVRTIPLELEQCGAFCEGSDAYYLAFGQSNMEESSGKEVFRLVKYDKSWNRLGSAAVSNCYTTLPFDFTDHTALVEENGVLILHTSRQRYLTRDDGLRHQSNFTAKVRTSDMTVTYVADTFPKSNYTAHSFAQYAAFDGGVPVYVDQGDAYPRGFNLSVENGQGGGRQQNFFPFSGALGDNTTNAVGGGLGVSGSNYLFAGASSPQKGSDSLSKANVFLAVIPKSGGQAQIRWLTSLPGGSEYPYAVRMAQVNNNTFVVMWQTVKPTGTGMFTFGDFTYAVFDGQGSQVGQTQTRPGFALPTADPIVQDGRVRWARQELDRSGIFALRKNRYINIFELDIDANSPTAQTGPGASANQPGTSTDRPGADATRPGTGANRPGSDASRPGASTPGTGASPDSRYPTTTDEVNGISITRTQVADGGQTAYYREDWDGSWMEVSVKGSEITFSGCIRESGYTRAILSVVTSPTTFISTGQPFSISTQVSAADLANGRNVTVGVAGDGESVWTAFRSGASLKAVLDGSGNPTLRVSLPFWLR